MSADSANPPRLPGWLTPALTILCVFAIYAPVRDFGFSVYDDYGWLVENDIVNGGFSWSGLRRALSQSVLGNWVPLTWFSHMLDVELFGLDAGRHHVVNVALHLATSLVLFAALRRMTGQDLPSAFVALVFAVHPTHVESVVWLTERRDVLFGLFGALSLLAWARYAQSGERRFFGLSALAFAAGLLSKPMLVTLPLLLLLLDYWPLARGERGWRQLVAEKLVFVAIAGAVAGATLVSQADAGAVVTLDMLPAATRITNAITSSVAYLASSAWPTPLAVFYPYPEGVASLRVAAAAALLAALTAGALWQARARPWFIVGWLWFSVSLLPVIGLIQVGSQARADRYLYLPLIGLAIAAAWALNELSERDGLRRKLVLAAAGMWLLFCVGLAREQVETWRDDVTLFEHARQVSGDHPIILVNLAEAHERAGNADTAIELYLAGLEGYAHAPRARTRLGVLLAARGRPQEAAAQFEEALLRHPDEPRSHFEAGRLLLGNGQPEAAVPHFEAEDERFPGSSETRFHLAQAKAATGERAAAVDLLIATWQDDPNLADTPLLDTALVADAMAEALATLGRSERALHWTRRGILLAKLSGDQALAERLQAELSEREGAAAR